MAYSTTKDENDIYRIYFDSEVAVMGYFCNEDKAFKITMFFDDGSEDSFDDKYFYAIFSKLEQSAKDILVSGYILRNYLDQLAGKS